MARPGERLPRGDTEPARGGDAARRPGLELREALARVQGRARAPPLPEGGPRRLAQGRAARRRGPADRSGKTAVAVQGIERVGRSALVVVPTLALLKQWYSVLFDSFGASVTVGLLGGGYHEVTPLTVTTYDSAYIHAERYGDRFALVVYDEVHHLPAPKNAVISKMLIAPYSLGLTATPERPDGGHELLPELVGPIVYRRSPEDLAGIYLAPFELVRIPVELTAHERFEYAQADAVYRDFLAKHRLPMRSPEDWQRFILVAATSHSGGGRRYWRRGAGGDPGGRHAEGGDPRDPAAAATGTTA